MSDYTEKSDMLTIDEITELTEIYSETKEFATSIIKIESEVENLRKAISNENSLGTIYNPKTGENELLGKDGQFINVEGTLDIIKELRAKQNELNVSLKGTIKSNISKLIEFMDKDIKSTVDILFKDARRIPRGQTKEEIDIAAMTISSILDELEVSSKPDLAEVLGIALRGWYYSQYGDSEA